MLPLTIEPFILGPWQTNCYVLHQGAGTAERSAPCWIIDAGFDPHELIQFIHRQHLEPQSVLLTHAHVDHIAGLEEIRGHWPTLPILIHEMESAFLGDPTLNLSSFIALPLHAPEPTGTLRHKENLTLAGKTWEVRHTPGHSPGGITLYQPEEGTAFVGDTLFNQSIGRSDFPTSDPAALMRSIREQLLSLPDATRVLPGHGFETTIGAERRSNPYIQG